MTSDLRPCCKDQGNCIKCREIIDDHSFSAYGVCKKCGPILQKVVAKAVTAWLMEPMRSLEQTP